MSAPALKIRTGRRAEIGLLVFAVLIVGAAEAIVEATRNDKLSGDVIVYTALTAVLAIVTHLAVRFSARYADPVLVPSVVLLNGLGVVMIHRLDLGIKQTADEGGPQRYNGDLAPSQMVWTALGLALFVGILLVLRDHRQLAK